MLKKWLAAAALCGICLLAPAVVLAGEPGDPGRTEAEGDEDRTYQAIQQGTNAQGLKIITNPLWEYDDIRKRYRLVK